MFATVVCSRTVVQWLMIIVMGLGLICTFAFHVGLHEEHTDDEQTVTFTAHRRSMEWYDWMKEHQFYLVI